jgi:acetyl-CoA carboxylase carboxyltransferase component
VSPSSDAAGGPAAPAPGTRLTVAAPLQGTVVLVPVANGDTVSEGEPLLILESMKMEHVVRSPAAGVVRTLEVEVGALVAPGDAVAIVEASGAGMATDLPAPMVDLDMLRPDLEELLARQGGALDTGRPEVVERRHLQGRRTARENVADLCDPGSFTEYGSLAIAAQRGRRPIEELIERTPADGLVAGVGRVNSAEFDDERSRCAVLSYDYTVMAGTQGAQNHRKKDRLFELVRRLRLPVVLFAEGGGGRPGDTDYAVITGLDTMAFAEFGALSGLVPLVGVVSGFCFAGNAALLGCCDVIIATPGTSIGMGGPAMIEGGGLGTVRPEDIGPLDVQVGNGVVDVVAEDEADAVRLAR